MQERSVGRVVVCVDDSLAGLRALREAVELAHRRGAELRAVRTYRLPSRSVGGCWYPELGPQPHNYATEDELKALKRDAAAAVVRAFQQAMGAVPCGVVVCVQPTNGPAHRVLVDDCQENDLLVVAASRHLHWWWPAPRPTVRRCLARAVCPVLVVPAPQGARDLGRWPPWRGLQRRQELAALLGDTPL